MLSTSSNHLHFHVQSSRLTKFHVFSRKRRLKFQKNSPKFSCKLEPLNSDNLFQNLISKLKFPSKSSLYLPDPNTNNEAPKGERILFTSPTPFNRFVLLRCPSISIQGSELLDDDLNDRLLKEDRHYVVKIINERIEVKEAVVYQRTCVSTGDGGVISLDWPENLDLIQEHGIDTTVLLVPGTAQGSKDGNVMSFVSELVKSGCFPVVMNPRGCAGSPLTTPRLFTAADSDDICTAIQFVNKVRPGNTLMSIGWGLGANMLTKYLAEVSEKTPLTAATCIDSPFDLEEATRSSPYHVAIDQKLTSGLVDILQSNKELFQGRPKRFNVEKALSSTSLRDFEREISMISYGFESIEAFYSKSSTRELVGNVKIPLLFIQSDEGMVPPFSVPRGIIAENPFTSLLLCSDLPSGNNVKETSVLPWCQHFAMEWLTAVELGFLKGRHPTLTDVDITINPSASLLVENKEHSGVNEYANIKETIASNESRHDLIDNIETGTEGDPVSQGRETGEKSEESGLDDDIPVSETAEDDKSQALQSAEAVMKMLDAFMPGALEEEQKRKVMIAMVQGETLMRAVEGAVPEEVWGTMTTGVSEIMQNQGLNFNLTGMMNDPPRSDDSSVDTSNVQEETVNEGIDDVRSVEDLVDEIPSGNDKETAVKKSIEDKPQNVQAQSEHDDVGSELEKAKDSIVNKKEKVKADMEVSDDQNESGSTSKMTNGKRSSGSPKVEDEDNHSPSNSEEETPVVSQAVDAVTKFNDDPQEAVNSVIGVAENVAAKLEESSGDESEKSQEGSTDGANDESG